MENEPVKVKMQLHAARPSIQGAAPARPAAQAAVEAVEARWRAEDKKVKSERRKKGCVGCLSWLFLLLVAVGTAWYFLGEKYLPSEYTFPKVWEQIKNWWSQPASKVPLKEKIPLVPVNPADAKTASERARMKEFLKQLEMLCSSSFPTRTEAIGIKTDACPIGQAMLNEIVSADNWYFKAQKKVAEMEVNNEWEDKRKREEIGTRQTGRYRAELLQRQKNSVDKSLEDCTRIRIQVAQRAIKAIKAASSQWTGPKSRSDVAQFLNRLDKLAKQLKTSSELPRKGRM